MFPEQANITFVERVNKKLSQSSYFGKEAEGTL